MRDAYTYILCNKPYGTLYIGSTRNIIRRIWEHKNRVVPGFTSIYHVYQLVYYEIQPSILAAAKRERQLKRWHRPWKLELIEQFNPSWMDLYDSICI